LRIVSRLHSPLTFLLTFEFFKVDFDTKYNEIAEKIEDIGLVNSKQRTAINMSLEILEEMRTEKDKISDFHNSNVKQIKLELERIRKNLPKLEKNEQVLAKWSDDSWYYFGTIKEVVSKYTYIVVDANNYEEEIARENIVTSEQSLDAGVSVSQSVFILISKNCVFFFQNSGTIMML
jgi:hypothetical protein